ncbi:MAG: hypothetical protein MUF85_03780, partial [Patescibacteria group bacterium]|nr:hypothetical protein [Patescibacteria group bacterium]
MMNFIKSIYYYFSQYTDPEEHKVGKFFSNVNEKNNKTKVIREANIYLQRNIIIVNLWLERKYKGYNYLTKSKRKILYKNSELIKTDFEKYCNRYDLGTNLVLNSVNHRVNKISESNMQKLIYLTKIMTYLSPGNGLYNYRTSTTFGELLKDPKHSKITGDCNQIVTLYIYLFSLKYSINDLRLITIPGHVALRFCDLDIEATSGKFVDYSSKQPQELPIEEIIGINLLDTTDEYFQTHKIDSRFLLESARLAFILSSSGEIVATNLSIAYNNAIVDSVNKNNYTLALSYAKQYKNNQLLNYVSN